MTVVRDGIITNLSETDNLDPDDAALVATNGTAPPATTPVYVGQFYVDTSARKLYFAVGTSSVADWEPAN
jgi:hypothetical protein